MEKILKIISKTLSTVLVATVVVLAVLLAGVRLVGLTPYTVLSGSMEPEYHVGSIIYVKEVNPEELQLQDPVTFRISGDTIVTHRIVEILGSGSSELSFRTKGDANKVTDGIIPASAIIGKPVFSIPYLGFISNFVQKPQGLICVVGCAAAVLALTNMIDILIQKKTSNPESDGDKKIG